MSSGVAAASGVEVGSGVGEGPGRGAAVCGGGAAVGAGIGVGELHATVVRSVAVSTRKPTVVLVSECSTSVPFMLQEPLVVYVKRYFYKVCGLESKRVATSSAA